MAESATDRVRSRLQALKQAKRFSQTRVARALGIDQSAVNKKINTARTLDLDFIEAVCQDAGIPISELVAEPESTLKELDPREAMVLRAMRKWPGTVTQSLADFLSFFVDEPIAASQERSLREHWKHLNQWNRDALLAVAVLLRHKIVGPEERARLLDRLTEEAEAALKPARE